MEEKSSANLRLQREFSNLIYESIRFSDLLDDTISNDIERTNLVPAKKRKLFDIEEHEILTGESCNNEKERNITSIVSNTFLQRLQDQSKSSSQSIHSIISNFIKKQIMEIVSSQKNSQPEEFKKNVKKLSQFSMIITSKSLLSSSEVSQIVFSSKSFADLPLVAIYELYKIEVLSFEAFLSKVYNMPQANQITNEICSIVVNSRDDKFSEQIIKMVVCSLIVISYEFPQEKFGLLKTCAQEMLKKLTNAILESVIEKQTLVSTKTEAADDGSLHKMNVTNIYKLSINQNSLSSHSLEQFLSESLSQILSFNPKISLTDAFQNPTQWKLIKSNRILVQFLETIISGLGIEKALRIFDEVVTRSELNWGCVLTFIAVLVTTSSSASSHIRDLIESYLQNGCDKFENEFLILGFLFARHACQEGRHIFPPYSQWFAATFGSESRSPASKKQAFIFLMKFLTDLVPHENSLYLRAHLNQSIFIPRGCQSVFKDYQHLARARMEDPQFQFDFMEDKDSKIAEVDTLVEEFQRSSKIPSSLMDVSIFKRSYFLNTLLPVLLKPRILPSSPDARIELIERLQLAGKIPQNLYSVYKKECAKLSDDQNSTISDVMIIEDTAFDSFHQSLAKFTKLPHYASDLQRTSLKILSEISSNLEDILPHSTSRVITLNMPFSSDSIEKKVLKDIKDAILAIWSRHTCKSMDKSLQFHICGRTQEMDLVSRLVRLLASSVSLQNCLWSSLLSCLKDTSHTDNMDNNNIFVYGLTLSEMPDEHDTFLPIALEEGKVPLPPKNFILANLTLKSADSTWNICSLLNTWMEMSIGHLTKVPEMLEQTYCLLAQRVSSLPWLHKGLRGVSLNSFDSKHKHNLPLLSPSHVPNICRLYWKQDFMPKKINLRTWVEFEIRTRWPATVPMGVRISHLHYWFIHYLKTNYSDVTGDLRKPFLEVFWPTLKGMTSSQDSCAEIVILLQRIAFDLTPNLSLLLEWQKYITEDEVTCADVYQYLSLCKCLPHSLLFGSQVLFKHMLAFKELVNSILKFNSAFYLDSDTTRYFLQVLLTATNTCNKNNMIHIVNCIDGIRDSLIMNWSSIRFVLSNHDETFQKVPYLTELASNIDSFCPYSILPHPLPASMHAMLLLSNLLQNQDIIVSKYDDLLVNFKDCSSLSVVFQYFSLQLGLLMINSSLPLLPNDNEVRKLNSMEIQQEFKNINDCYVKILYISMRILEKATKLCPLERFLLDRKWLDAFYSSAWQFFLLGVLRTTISYLDSKIFCDKDASYAFNTAVYCFSCLCKLFDSDIQLSIEPNDDLDFLAHISLKIESYSKKSFANFKPIPDFVLSICDKEMRTWLERIFR